MTFYIKTQVRASQKPTWVASQAFTSAYVVWTDVTSLGRVNARRLRKKLLVSTDPGAYRGGQGGPRKVPTMSQIFSSIQYICFQKTSGLNMGASNLFLVPGAISPRYAPAPIWQVWLQQGTTWLQLRKILLDCGGRSYIIVKAAAARLSLHSVTALGFQQKWNFPTAQEAVCCWLKRIYRNLLFHGNSAFHKNILLSYWNSLLDKDDFERICNCNSSHCRYFYTAQHHGLRRLPRNWGRAVALVTSHTHASQVTRGCLQATSHVSRPQFVADRGFPANGKLTLSATPSNVHSIASQKFLPSSGDNNDKNLHISTARHRWKTADLSSIDFWI